MDRPTLQITDNLERLLDIFPRAVRKGLEKIEDDLVDLIEVVMDLGRMPQARLPGRYLFLSQDTITR
jgi:stage III sporulation protein SpoIIIAA